MVEFIRELIQESLNYSLDGVSDTVIMIMGIVIALLLAASVVAFLISFFLSIAYIRYNHKKNAAGLTGAEVARTILDENDLQHIRVSKNGSLLFGNSYSHFFKKVRLRRLTWKKRSVTSLSMAAQKSALAILDKEGDPDMKSRIRMTPMIYFGPLAFVPLLLIGAALDVFVFQNPNGVCMTVSSLVGVLIYLISFRMSIKVLKTEKKAQVRALELMRTEGLATEDELKMSKHLFRLYNIEYVNNMVIALLELVYRILQIFSYAQGGSSNAGSDSQ